MSFPRIEKLDRNFIINGNFDYWQRGITQSLSGSFYLADRFFNTYTAGTSMSVSRRTDVPDSRSTYSMQLDGIASTNVQVQQKIEDVYAKEMANQFVTFKVKYKIGDSTGTPLRLNISAANATNNFSTVTNVISTLITPLAAQNVWASYVVSLAMPAGAANGVIFQLVRDSGTTPVTTTTFFSQIQMSIGQLADLEFCYAARNAIQELAVCQRYYEKSFSSDVYSNNPTATTNFIILATMGDGASQHYFTQKFAVVKRAVPTVTPYAINGVANQIQYFYGGGFSGNASTDSIATDTDVQFRAFSYNTNAVSRAAFNWTADAEL